jgi:hypothetical protein
MLGWFKAIMPKEERFFTLFVQHATIVAAGAEALRGVPCAGARAADLVDIRAGRPAYRRRHAPVQFVSASL